MISAFLIIVSLGKYLIKAFSTREAKLSSSTIACAFACLTIEELIKRVIRWMLSVDILHIIQLFVVVVKYQLIQAIMKSYNKRLIIFSENF